MTCHIYDGMSVVQKLGKPVGATSFRDYAKRFLAIIFKNPHKAKRIDLVMDNYQDLSIKNSTRLQRGGTKAIHRIVDSGDVPLPQQWNLFIHSVFNKRQLTNFLSNEAVKHSKSQNVEFITSGGYFDICQYDSNFGLEDEMLISNHEEADTRILLHILSAKKSGYQRCIIECGDTDVLVLLVHFKKKLTPEIWLKVGKRNSERYIPIHNINLEANLIKNLKGFHALTGSDTTSQLSGLGKKTCWKT